MAHVRDGSRLCENVHEQRVLRIVFSLFFFRDCQSGSFVIRGNRANFLRASSTSEFSHSLGQKRKHQLPFPTSAMPFGS